MDMVIKLAILLLFFGVTLYVGFRCRKNAADVNGFVLGGRTRQHRHRRQLRKLNKETKNRNGFSIPVFLCGF